VIITAPEAPACDDVAPDHSDATRHDPDMAAPTAWLTGSRGGAAPGYHAPGRLASAIRLLFVEARRRRHRRRAAFTFLSAALVAAIAIAYGVTARHGDRPTARRGQPARVVAHHARFDLPAAAVAWFGAGGQLRIGGVASLAQHAVASVGYANDPCCVTVAAGHRLYWANVLSRRNVVQDYDFTTGTVRAVAAGWAVFPSASGQAVYIAQSSTRLLEVSATGTRMARRLVTPPGWHVVPLPWATADGIAVSRGDRSGQGPRPVIGIWRPTSGKVAIIGRGQALATVTPPAGSYSLIAWQPNGCGLQHCPINVTNTATHVTVTVRSPLRYGFLDQGDDVAFSPDGSELVGFISLNALNPNQAALFVPALVNTSSGAVRVLRNAVLENDELSGWAVWLPGGRLIVGPSKNPRYPAYAIDARSSAVRPFTFFPRSGDTPDDITYGAVLLPGSDTMRPRRSR
jgi:hypothetical protein